MEEILHQLISSFPIIYKVLYIPGGAGFHPSTVPILGLQEYKTKITAGHQQKNPRLKLESCLLIPIPNHTPPEN